MKQLVKEINEIFENANIDGETIEKINKEKAIFPFTLMEKKMDYLLFKNIITYETYCILNKEYIERNKYIELFDLAPRTFGETWAEKHILFLFPDFIKATKRNLKTLYPKFVGEFDLWIDNTRIEVKACRANDNESKGRIASRAYLHEEAKSNSFKYHYQQLKPSCCDIFIWIGVCRDKILYWVLTSDELIKSGKMSPQHRNKDTGDKEKAVFEGQVFLTEEELEEYKVEKQEILNKIREKMNQN